MVDKAGKKQKLEARQGVYPQVEEDGTVFSNPAPTSGRCVPSSSTVTSVQAELRYLAFLNILYLNIF